MEHFKKLCGRTFGRVKSCPRLKRAISITEYLLNRVIQAKCAIERTAVAFGWPIAPEYFAVALKEVHERYGYRLPPVYITENGASFEDEVGEDGRVHDAARTAYLADHLGAALAAVAPGGSAEGLDLRGYFAWSLLDNWEWAAGFTQRFGIIHVDFETGQRTPKASYDWLAQVSRLRPRA